MKTNGNDKALEAYKIFPYIAWVLTFIFALFVYNITMKLNAVAENLQAQTEFLQERINVPAQQIENFDKPTTTKKM